MKIKFYFALVAVTFTALLNAQNQIISNENSSKEVNSIDEYTVRASVIRDEFKSAGGSPYLDENFSVGTISKGNDITTAFMRVNVYFEEIEVIKDKGSKDVTALKKNSDMKVIIAGKTYVYAIKTNGEKRKGGYFEVLTSGKEFDLYKENTVRYIKPTVATTSLTSDRPGRFSPSTEYYLVNKQNKFISIPSNRRRLAKMFDYKQEEIKGFLKENGIKTNKEEDLEEFVNFYNDKIAK